MAKFYGEIGFATTQESPAGSGIWREIIVTKNYRGEVSRVSSRLEGSGVNNDVNINNVISIVADPYANENFASIRYVKWMNTKWKVTSVDVAYPRLTLNLGGVYNGEPTVSAN